MTEEVAIALLDDLGRWRFGELLARRAQYQGLEPEQLEREVRAYRYGILCAVDAGEAIRRRELAEPRVDADWALCAEWADFASGLAWSSEAEARIAERFLARLGPCSEAMSRFARGKAFKYGRRVRYLIERARPLDH